MYQLYKVKFGFNAIGDKNLTENIFIHYLNLSLCEIDFSKKIRKKLFILIFILFKVFKLYILNILKKNL